MPLRSFARAACLALAFAVAGCAPESESASQEGDRSVVVIETSKGTITAELLDEQAPKSVENFLAYVDAGFYDGTTFHRVIPGFMIQGGGYDVGGSLKDTNAPIENEADNGVKNERGTLAMARTADVNSATSQFFINLVDNAFLDHGQRDFGYAVFGRVIDGMDVVDAIAETGNASGMVSDAVTIEKIERKG